MESVKSNNTWRTYSNLVAMIISDGLKLDVATGSLSI